MGNVTLASTPADAAAADDIEQHHALLAGQLDLLTVRLLDASGSDFQDPRDALVRWCHSELLPHAAAEERTVYDAARDLPETRLLVEAMVAEHQAIVEAVTELERATTGIRAAAAGWALGALFRAHLAKENDQLVPALAATPGISIAALLADMHQHVGHASTTSPEADNAAHPHTCSCGETDAGDYPELDARQVPHKIRHATIFGALDSVAPGHGMILVAPHDPLPLLAQIEQRSPGAFAISYVERGPEAWRLLFVRR